MLTTFHCGRCVRILFSCILAFGLFHSNLCHSQIPNPLPDTLTLVVSAQGEQVELNLYKYSIRASDFRVRFWTASHGYEQSECPTLRTYRGTVSEEPNLRVLAVIYPGGYLRARATAGQMDVWEMGPIDVSGQLGQLSAGHSDGKERQHGATIVRAKASQPYGSFPPLGPIQLAQIGADVRRDLVDKEGGWEQALAYAEYELTRVDEYYLRDIGLAFEITEVVIRLDKYYVDSAGGYLKAGDFLERLKNTWNSTLAGNWDYVHGFKGTSGGVSGVGSPFSVGPALHEIGHSLLLEHPNYGWNMQHPLSHEGGIIRRDQWADRFTDLPGCAIQEPVHPHATLDIARTEVNEPVLIDVLDNDWDSNGEDVSIMYYTEQTVPGGYVEIASVSDDRGGLRQALLYTPPTGYVGKDLVIYTVQNEAGLHNTELAHIYILGDRVSPAGHWTLDAIVGSATPDVSPYGHDGFISARYRNVQAQIDRGIQVPSGGTILFGQADVLPAIPQHWDKIGDERAGYYPLEKRTSNIFDPLDCDFSAAFWFKPSPSIQASTEPIRLLGKSNPNDKGVGFRIEADSQGLTLRVREWGGLFRTKVRSARYDASIIGDTWHHVAVVFDRNTNQGQLWLNGVCCAKACALEYNSFIFAGRSDLELHDGSTTACAYDDLYIFYRALRAAEIQRLMNPGDDYPGVGEDFETGDFSRFSWEHYGNAAWSITSSQKHSGNYSAESGSIDHNENSSLEVALDCIEGDIRFSYKVSTESGFDYLRFYIDGDEQDKWSGEHDWAEVSFAVTEGRRTFRWEYCKDSSASYGDDAAWIDDIVFPVN